MLHEHFELNFRLECHLSTFYVILMRCWS